MFLNNLMFISIPLLGLLFTVMLVLNRSARRPKSRPSISADLSSRSVSIPVNSSNDQLTSRLKTSAPTNDDFALDDDDEDLIQSDPSSISAWNFYANDEIELRLSNDADDLEMQQV